MLIKAFGKISGDFSDYQLHIYGEGPCKEELETLINDEGLIGKVILKGRSENVISEMNHASVFCLSSDFEGMSNSLIEAFCLGLPIVTTNVSGVESFIENGRNALVVNVGDTDSFASAIRQILTNDQLRLKMSSVNKDEGKQFRIDNIVTLWTKLFQELIHKE